MRSIHLVSFLCLVIGAYASTLRMLRRILRMPSPISSAAGRHPKCGHVCSFLPSSGKPQSLRKSQGLRNENRPLSEI